MVINNKNLFSFTNLILVIKTNILVFWTWYKIVTATVDTMFMGLLLIPLILVTIYYLGLLQWAFRHLKKTENNTDDSQIKNIVLLLLNVIPLILIYKLTT